MAVITRAAWGAGGHRAGAIRTPVSRLFLHHTVTPFWTGAQAARNLQRIARERGFADISYSWLTDRQGNELEGRGWGRQGAHTRGYNSTAHAISLVGNLQANTMPAGMLRGAASLTRKHARHGPGRITHGHRDVASTSCPGQHAYRRIADINAVATGKATAPSGGTMDPLFCRRGDKGDGVLLWQTLMRMLGLYTGELDSDYGPKTAAAIRKGRIAGGSAAAKTNDSAGDRVNGQVAAQLLRAFVKGVAPSADTAQLRAEVAELRALVAGLGELVAQLDPGELASALQSLQDLHGPDSGHMDLRDGGTPSVSVELTGDAGDSLAQLFRIALEPSAPR